jgi:hypothetical protein
MFPDHAVAVLAAAYGKSSKSDISPPERKMLKAILAEIAKTLDEEVPKREEKGR